MTKIRQTKSCDNIPCKGDCDTCPYEIEEDGRSEREKEAMAMNAPKCPRGECKFNSHGKCQILTGLIENCSFFKER